MVLKLYLIYKEAQQESRNSCLAHLSLAHLSLTHLSLTHLSLAQLMLCLLKALYNNSNCLSLSIDNSILIYSIYFIILDSQFQSMKQEELMKYYKEEYDSTENTVEQLKKEQREMIHILSQMNKKVNKQVQKKHLRMNGNLAKSRWSKNSSPQKLRSTRNSKAHNSDKQNLILPSIVADSQLKNSQKYHKILTNQNNKLEKRLQEHQNEKSIKNKIEQETSKITTMRKDNKSMEIEISKISKNAEDIIKEPNYRGYQAVYEELVAEVDNKRAQNNEKAKRIERNSEKVYNYQQQLMSIQAKLDKVDEDQGQKSRVKEAMDLSDQAEYLRKKKQKIAINLNSLDKRLSQQYYSKLKQLQSQTQKTTELQQKYQQLCTKIQEAEQIHAAVSLQSPSSNQTPITKGSGK